MRNIASVLICSLSLFLLLNVPYSQANERRRLAGGNPSVFVEEGVTADTATVVGNVLLKASGTFRVFNLWDSALLRCDVYESNPTGRKLIARMDMEPTGDKAIGPVPKGQSWFTRCYGTLGGKVHFSFMYDTPTGSALDPS